MFAGRLQPAGPDRALREGAEEEQSDGSVRNPRGTRQPCLLRTQRLRQLDQRRGKYTSTPEQQIQLNCEISLVGPN